MPLSELSSEGLSRLCADTGDSEAWLEFVRRFRRPIALTALRVARMWGAGRTSIVDDLVQETFLRLCADQCRLLRTFTPSTSTADALGAFIKVIASNVAHDYFRGQSAAKRGGPATAARPELPDEHLLSDLWDGARIIERDVQLQEIERVLADPNSTGITDRDRTIFRLYFVQGMAAAAIASIPAIQLTTKGVESAIHRVSRYLRSRLNPDPSATRKAFSTGKGTQEQTPLKEAGA